MGFKLDLAAAAQDAVLHFNCTTKLSFAGYSIRPTKIEDPSKGTLYWQDISWETTEELTDLDGAKHPAGTTIHQQRSFWTSDEKSKQGAARDAAYAYTALAGKRPSPGFDFEQEQEAFEGKVVNSVITFTPGRKEGEKGFDNFRHTSVKE
jgi:hypothetical protein